MKIYDFDGNETTWEWLHSVFGPEVRVDSRDATKPGFDVVELRAAHGHSTLLAVVLAATGERLPGVKVARWWDDSENNDKNLDELPHELQTWHMKGKWGHTKENGDIGFGMGGGDQYDWKKGRYAVSEIWVEGNSARAHGLGWPWGEDYHIDTTFQFSGVEPGPPPDPEDDIDTVIGYLQAIKAHAEAALRLLEDM